MRVTSLVLALIAAVFLLLGGCSAFVSGSFFGAVDEAFEQEEDERTTAITSAGAFAVVFSIFLFLAGGLSIAAPRVATILLLLSVPVLIGIIVADPYSLFAVTYYLSLVLIGTCSVLMLVAWRRTRLE